jgi:predicted nuclease with TOPRIM domain
MSQIAESLSASSAAIAACNIDGLEGCIRNQESLCSKIRALDARLEAMQARHQSLGRENSQLSVSFANLEDASLRAAMARLKEVHQRVKSLNQTHAELLRRSRRTVLALSRAYQTVTTDLYANPTGQLLPVGERA